MESIAFISDSKKTISLYREDLIKSIQGMEFNCYRVGLNDLLFSLTIVFRSSFLVVSNLRANMIVMSVLPFKKKLIILNGLGNATKSFLARWILIRLIRLQGANAVIAVQNYRDMRWLRRIGIPTTIIFGSGGRDLGISEHSSVSKTVIISRHKKILLQEHSIKKYLAAFPRQSLEIIGVTRADMTFSDIRISCLGVLAPNNFFQNGSVFFQPHGYSEGTPHTLVDALCSGCDVVMEKKTFIFLGMSNFYPSDFGNSEFITLSANKNYANHIFGVKNITKQYLSVLNKYIAQRSNIER